MAEKEKTSKVVLERTYVVPLRKEWLKSPKWKRTKKAVRALREFIFKHMKAREVKIGKYLNLKMWEHGIRNPPHKIKVDCSKDEDGIVRVELFGAPKEEKKESKKPQKKGGAAKSEKGAGEAEEKLEKNLEEAKEEQKDKAKEIEKEELKELKREEAAMHHHRQKTESRPRETKKPVIRQKEPAR